MVISVCHENTMNIYVPVDVTVTQPNPPLCLDHLRSVKLYYGYLIMLKPPEGKNHYGAAFRFDCVNGQVRRYRWYSNNYDLCNTLLDLHQSYI